MGIINQILGAFAACIWNFDSHSDDQSIRSPMWKQDYEIIATFTIARDWNVN
jgi:hypothetical protein